MKNKAYVSILFLTVLFFSCKKETVEDPILPSMWTEMKEFRLDNKIQMNSHANDDRIVFLSANQVTKIDQEYGISNEQIPMTFYKLSYDTGIKSKYPITDDCLVGAGGDYLHISTFNDMKYPRHVNSINLKNHDPKFSSFEGITKNLGFTILFNNKNQCLVPYHKFINEENSLIGGSHFFVVDFDLRDHWPQPIEINSISKFEIELEPGDLGIFKMEAIDSYFFLIYQSRLIRLDENGNMVVVYDGLINDIIESNGTYFGLNSNGLFASEDQGLTWTFIQTIDTLLLFANYADIEGQKIAFINDQMWKIDFSTEGLKIEELDNEGLATNQITSISGFKNQVFVTTMSGVFTKPLDEFFN